MKVQRVHTEYGSHIEPPCDRNWDDLTTLRWNAAVVSADTGLQVDVRRADVWVGPIRIRNQYDVFALGAVAGTGKLHDAWDFLNGVRFGAELVRRVGTGGSP